MKGERTMYALTVKQQTITSNSIDYLWHISRKLRRRGYAMIHLYRIAKQPPVPTTPPAATDTQNE
jgi:hypothetical protein